MTDATADDGPARAARAAARRLAPEFGGALVADVESALRPRSARRPAQYVDPIAVAALVVAAAELAWTVVNDLRERARKPTAPLIVQQLRIELPDHPGLDSAQHERVLEAVADETVPPDETDPPDED